MNIATLAYKGFVSLFKTTRTNVLKEIIRREGFDYVKSSAFTTSISDLPNAYINEFLDSFYGIIEMPNNRQLQEEITRSVKYAKYSTSRTYNGNTLAFTKEKGGETTFVTWLHNKDTTKQTYNIMYSVFSMRFTLAPDIQIWNKGLSVLGGIYSNSKDYVKFVPRSITTKDIDSILSFMSMVTFRSIFTELGVPHLDLPSPYE